MHTHYQVAELFLELHAISPEPCAKVVAEELLHPQGVADSDIDHVEGYRRFSTLWRLLGELCPGERVFTKGMMLMLDALDDTRPLVRLVARSWLRESLMTINRILDPLFLVLLHPTTVQDTSHQYNTVRWVIFVVELPQLQYL